MLFRALRVARKTLPRTVMSKSGVRFDLDGGTHDLC